MRRGCRKSGRKSSAPSGTPLRRRPHGLRPARVPPTARRSSTSLQPSGELQSFERRHRALNGLDVTPRPLVLKSLSRAPSRTFGADRRRAKKQISAKDGFKTAFSYKNQRVKSRQNIDNTARCSYYKLYVRPVRRPACRFFECRPSDLILPVRP